MPMGKYKDFASCVAAQVKKGHSHESAQAICGEIKKRAEGNVVEKTAAWLSKSLGMNDDSTKDSPSSE